MVIFISCLDGGNRARADADNRQRISIHRGNLAVRTSKSNREIGSAGGRECDGSLIIADGA